MTLNERLEELEKIVIVLNSKMNDLSKNTEEIHKKPISVVGGNRDQCLTRPIDISSGRGQSLGSPVLWNDSEIKSVYGEEPDSPNISYNKHSHNRFSGGPLINGVVEIAEYVWGSIVNKNSLNFLKPNQQPKIAVDVNSKGETVQKIGLLDLIFNADNLTWGTPAYEIDVKKCYLVERDADGNIVVDSKGQEKKSLLYSSDTNKTSVIWDENGQCFRFLAVYSEGND